MNSSQLAQFDRDSLEVSVIPGDCVLLRETLILEKRVQMLSFVYLIILAKKDPVTEQHL